MDKVTWMKIGILAATVLLLAAVLVLAFAGGDREGSGTETTKASNAPSDPTQSESTDETGLIGGTGLVSGDIGEGQSGSNQSEKDSAIEIPTPEFGNPQDSDGEADVPTSGGKPAENGATEGSKPAEEEEPTQTTEPDDGDGSTQDTKPTDPETDEEDVHAQIDADALFGSGK